MAKKKNNELRKQNDARKEHEKEKDYLIRNGLDEAIADEITRTKKRKNQRGGEN